MFKGLINQNKSIEFQLKLIELSSFISRQLKYTLFLFCSSSIVLPTSKNYRKDKKAAEAQYENNYTKVL